MIPYFLVFSVCIYLCYRSHGEKWFLVFVSCLFLSFLAGFRDISIGSDTWNYKRLFFDEACYYGSLSQLINANPTLDIGYLALAWFGAQITKDYWVMLFLTELLITTCTFFALFRMKILFNADVAIFCTFFLMLTYNYSLNAMRQECAIALGFYAFSYFMIKKWFMFVLWSVLAISIHSSAIVILFIPLFYYVANLKNAKKRNLVIILMVGVLILAFISFYYLLNTFVSYALLNPEYIKRYGEEALYGGKERIGFIPLLLSLLIYYTMFLTYKRGYLAKKYLIFHFIINTIYLSSLFLTLYSVFLYRIGLYFLIINIYFYAVELTSPAINVVLRRLSILYVIVIWFYQYMLVNLAETVPYTSKLLGIC